MPQKYPNLGVAAFIDFYDVKSAIEARDTKHKLGGNELRTNFKAKTTERFDTNKKRMNETPEKIGKGQQQSQGRYLAVCFCCVLNRLQLSSRIQCSKVAIVVEL